MHFQDSLPKLPIPALKDTLANFLYSAEPLVTAAQLEEARALCADFAAGEGPRLQEALVEADKRVYSSYISKPWFDLYLRDRAPLLLNYNPQLTWVADPRGPSQSERAARLVYAATTFLRTLEADALAPDVFHTQPKRSKHPLWPEAMRLLPRPVAFYGAAVCGAYPLDMSQYRNLFRSTRIPKAEVDELRMSQGSRHIVVQRGGRFWALDVLNACGDNVPLPQLLGALDSICAAPTDPPSGAAGAHAAEGAPPGAGLGAGLFTSLPRDEWAALRDTLAAAAPPNAASLEEIDSALFALCLDEATPETAAELNRAMLHGQGHNRWLDKSFQLIVTANAQAAINFEHSWGDGVAVLRFFDEVHGAAASLGTETATPPTAPPRELEFGWTPALRAAAADARRRFDQTVESTDLAVLASEDFSTSSLKADKLSPDGMMQMAFQLAHERMHGHTASTYEAASTSAFKHGRTETIRSATPESAAFARAFCAPGASDSERAALMRAAVKNHSRICKDALMGKGMDRHLFALRKLAEAESLSPALFECSAHATLAKIILSTSTLSSEALDVGGFGPVNSDCYAIGYGIRDYGCGAHVMSYRRDAAGFVSCLEEAMRDMRAVSSPSLVEK